MKVEKQRMKVIKKILEKLPYEPIKEDYVICFPIETVRTKEVDGFNLTITDTKTGVEKKPVPFLFIQKNSREDKKGKIEYYTYISTGFGDITYARPFDFLLYCDIIGINLTKKDIESICQLDCYLINKENVLIAF